MNTDSTVNSMGKYFTSKIGELKEVRGARLACVGYDSALTDCTVWRL